MNILGVLPIQFFIFFDFMILIIGFIGLFVNRQNIIRSIICLEIIYLGINLNFLFISFYIDDILGSIISMVLIAVAGCEISLGVALSLVLFRMYNHIQLKNLVNCKS